MTKQSDIHIENSKRKQIHQLPDIPAQTIMKSKQQNGIGIEYPR